MNTKLQSLIKRAAENSKKIFNMYGYLNPILEVRTKDTIYPASVNCKSRSEIPQTIENMINHFQKMDVEMYAWNQTMTGTNIKTGAESSILLTIGELKNGDQGVLMTPFIKRGKQIEYQKAKWEDPKKFQNIFQLFTRIFNKPENETPPQVLKGRTQMYHLFLRI